MELPPATPSPDHFEFDLLCLEIEDFEPLPSVRGPFSEPGSDAEDASFDGQILAGLVTP